MVRRTSLQQQNIGKQLQLYIANTILNPISLVQHISISHGTKFNLSDIYFYFFLRLPGYTWAWMPSASIHSSI